ncbi:hypothetical protein [Nocardia wallacei]|uniref:hypothetical protein n=1 Tax=Nocardia wallacei TaxID=480035 RepID=UPI002453E401|nr:hypothetical protein [Nocardia wallacei]
MTIIGDASLVPAVRRAVKLSDTPSTASASDADAWADAIADGITGALADANPPLVTTGASNSAASIDGTLVLAWRQHLWWIYTHTASRPHSGVLALGTGADVALGSMHTALDLNTEPEHAVELAVRLACRYASGCGVDERGPLMYQTEPIE